MCGVAGFLDPRTRAEDAHSVLERMTDMMLHRGPDSAGTWHHAQMGIGLGHRRLSIVDLSPAGHQPMHSASRRYVISYNGEIYNCDEIRAELSAVGHTQFRGHSDTEVILAAVDAWGVHETVARLNGMFAIALVDIERRRIFLIRDRVGEKPLYYSDTDDRLVFASELKALRRGPGPLQAINANALREYMQMGYITSPRCIYENTYKVMPGECVEIHVLEEGRHRIQRTRYWSGYDAARAGLANQLVLSDADAAAQLRHLLGDAVRRRMVADVPLGAFLSGGIDSSTVVALMQENATGRTKTFSIGFSDQRFDEAQSARAVAAHLGTDHTELYLSATQALEIIPSLPDMYDEPFADASQIPTYLVSKLARQHVTVALSGDGGDELFCGYPRYELASQLANVMERIPGWARLPLSRVLRTVPLAAWNAFGMVVPERISAGRLGDRVYKLSERLEHADFASIYKSLLSLSLQPELALSERVRAELRAVPEFSFELQGSREAQMMAYDFATYLPDDILTKVDRASMAVSLETRVPLLDHRVVEFSWQIPDSQKRRGGDSKWLLRQVLYQLVPRHLVDRPKRGFSIPIEHWLRNELRDWAVTLLSKREIERWGYLDATVVPRLLDEHLSGVRTWTNQLWTALMFQAWIQRANG